MAVTWLGTKEGARPWRSRGCATRKPWDQTVGKYRNRAPQLVRQYERICRRSKMERGSGVLQQIVVEGILFPASGELGSWSAQAKREAGILRGKEREEIQRETRGKLRT